MKIDNQEFHVNGLTYTIRSAIENDAKGLSELRLQIDSIAKATGVSVIHDSPVRNVSHPVMIMINSSQIHRT